MTTPAFRRTIELVAPRAYQVIAGIEDEMHHFELALHHDGTSVVGIDAVGVRVPWATCGGAGVELDRLTGTALDAAPSAIAKRAAPRQQCTHLFDLATLAVRFAASGRSHRRYEAVVPDWVEPPYQAWVTTDTGLRIEWTIGREGIIDPEPYAGQTLLGGFISWCEHTLPPHEVDAALVLRRAAWMSAARRVDLDALSRLAESGLPSGACFSAQPERIDLALRNRGSRRDYGEPPTEWLAGMSERWSLDPSRDSSLDPSNEEA